MPFEVVLIEDNGFCDFELSTAGTEYLAFDFSVSAEDLKVVAGVLFQVDDAAAVLFFCTVINRRIYRKKIFVIYWRVTEAIL